MTQAFTARSQVLNSFIARSQKVSFDPQDVVQDSPLVQLLIRAGHLSMEELAEVCDIAFELKNSPEDVLIRSLSKEEAALVREVNEFIKANLLTLELALHGFQTALKHGIPFRSALRYHGFGW